MLHLLFGLFIRFLLMEATPSSLVKNVQLKVYPNTDQLEYNSELILEKKDDAKLKLSGRKGWGMKGSNTVYNVEKQSITEIIISKDGTERKDLPMIRVKASI